MFVALQARCCSLGCALSTRDRRDVARLPLLVAARLHAKRAVESREWRNLLRPLQQKRIHGAWFVTTDVPRPTAGPSCSFDESVRILYAIT